MLMFFSLSLPSPLSKTESLKKYILKNKRDRAGVSKTTGPVVMKDLGACQSPSHEGAVGKGTGKYSS